MARVTSFVPRSRRAGESQRFKEWSVNAGGKEYIIRKSDLLPEYDLDHIVGRADKGLCGREETGPTWRRSAAPSGRTRIESAEEGVSRCAESLRADTKNGQVFGSVTSREILPAVDRTAARPRPEKDVRIKAFAKVAEGEARRALAISIAQCRLVPQQHVVPVHGDGLMYTSRASHVVASHRLHEEQLRALQSPGLADSLQILNCRDVEGEGTNSYDVLEKHLMFLPQACPK